MSIERTTSALANSLKAQFANSVLCFQALARASRNWLQSLSIGPTTGNVMVRRMYRSCQHFVQ